MIKVIIKGLSKQTVALSFSIASSLRATKKLAVKGKCMITIKNLIVKNRSRQTD